MMGELVRAVQTAVLVNVLVFLAEYGRSAWLAAKEMHDPRSIAQDRALLEERLLNLGSLEDGYRRLRITAVLLGAVGLGVSFLFSGAILSVQGWLMDKPGEPLPMAYRLAFYVIVLTSFSLKLVPSLHERWGPNGYAFWVAGNAVLIALLTAAGLVFS